MISGVFISVQVKGLYVLVILTLLPLPFFGMIFSGKDLYGLPTSISDDIDGESAGIVHLSPLSGIPEVA